MKPVIAHLFETPRHGPRVARWIHDEFWRDVAGGYSVADIERLLVSRATDPTGIPVSLIALADGEPVGTISLIDTETYTVTGKAVYALWGIPSITGPERHQTLAGQRVGGKALVDVKIKVRSRWSDVLVTVVTLGIIVPRTVTAEGIVVK